MTIDDIASICHEANRVYCLSIGDASQKPWGSAEEWQKQSAANGVRWRLANMDAPASAQHDAWMADKLADGWKYGPEKIPARKEHFCLVPYDHLPEAQRVKDVLFIGIVRSLASFNAAPSA
jgi:hypothetical protein